MKSINLFLIYVFTFTLFFLLLSTLGMLWGDTYLEATGDRAWFLLYTIFIGWWVALIPCREYYYKHKDHFENFM